MKWFRGETMKADWVIVGLGNPGRQYHNSPHNIGAQFVGYLSESWGIPLNQKGKKYLWGQGDKAGFSLILVQPTTYMNLSGEALVELKKKGVKTEQLVVIHDEAELPIAQWRWKEGGGHKGHNGLRSIMSYMAGDFFRMRIGMGKPNNGDLAGYLLRPLPRESLEQIHGLFADIAEDLAERLFFQSKT